MSPDGTKVYGGVSTAYFILSFDSVGWTEIGSLDMQDVVGIDAPPGDQDWNLTNATFGGHVVHPGTGMMYAWNDAIELDGFGGTPPGAQPQPSLMRFDPDDGSGFEMLYRWAEPASGNRNAMLWWHPGTPDLIWIFHEYEQNVDLWKFDTTDDSVTLVDADLWPTVTSTLQGFSIMEYENGIVIVLRSGDASDEYRIVAVDVSSETIGTHDFDTAGATDFSGYPWGVDYDGRLFFSSEGFGQIDGVRPITPGTIGDLEPYDDCDIFLTAGEFPFYTQPTFWYAPADRSARYQSTNTDIFFQVP